EALLKQANIACKVVHRGQDALDALAKNSVDVVVTDLRLPDIDGMTLLKTIASESPDLPVVMMTAHGTVPIAVEAMKQGAADFLLKPFDRDEFIYVVKKALATAERAAAEPPKPPRAGELTESPAMQECRARIARASQSNATVLLLGESGTGK